MAIKQFLLLGLTLAAFVGAEFQCLELNDNEKIDCHPDPDFSVQECFERRCCYEKINKSGPPHCYYPKSYGGYELINYTLTGNGQIAFWRRTFPSRFPRDVEVIRFDVEYQTDHRVRVKITDAHRKRYESPYPKIKKVAPGHKLPNYKVDLDPEGAGFRITRHDGDVIFDSRHFGALIYSDQLLQISSPFSGRIYGLGEHRTTFWLDTNWKRYTMFNHDAAPMDDINLYGSHPFYLVMQPSHKSYGVFLHNSNAIEALLQPLPAITFRAIGGILDFYFFMGPTPADVVRQYTELIGRPFMPPYWSLGFHLCKYGYGSENVTRAVWERNKDAGIPLDVMWNDIDYMEKQNDFTIDKVNFAKLPQLVSDIHAAGMRYVPILDPGVSASEPRGLYPPYDEGVSMDIFVKDYTGKIFLGKVWNPNTTAFPDFTNPKTQIYWTNQIEALYEVLKFDGLWIDMNEPANFLDGSFDGCPKSELENPKFIPRLDGGILQKKTLCMTAKQHAGVHYNVHNLYGISEHEMTYNALEEIIGKRVFTLSRSSFPGTGSYGGHWSGDVFSTWHDMTKSVPEMLSYSLYGMAFTGADICGFNGNVTESLCNRWMQLGAFYPFSRNHNSLDTIHQDPAAFGPHLIKSSIKALKVRYTLLPYLYTLFYHAHMYGDTVVRPLFFEFPQDENTYTVDRSFLWGAGLYIVPVTSDNTEYVQAYLPKGVWYDWYDGRQMNSTGREVILYAPYDTIPLLVRGGTVLPTQEPAQTTTLSRNNKFTFTAFPDSQGFAEGTLFWDDGETLETIRNENYALLQFSLTPGKFTSKVIHWGILDSPKVDAVVIKGLKGRVTHVFFNQNSVKFEHKEEVLTVKLVNVPLFTNFTIQLKISE